MWNRDQQYAQISIYFLSNIHISFPERLLKKNITRNDIMLHWNSNSSTTNVTMNSLLTKNPTLTYLHTFLLCLSESGNHNNLPNSPTTSTMTSRVVTKMLTIITGYLLEFGMHANISVLARSKKLVSACYRSLIRQGLHLGTVQCKVLAFTQC
jgi:hypothetical protein